MRRKYGDFQDFFSILGDVFEKGNILNIFLKKISPKKLATKKKEVLVTG
jgi:hypothetical protein